MKKKRKIFRNSKSKSIKTRKALYKAIGGAKKKNSSW